MVGSISGGGVSRNMIVGEESGQVEWWVWTSYCKAKERLYNTIEGKFEVQ